MTANEFLKSRLPADSIWDDPWMEGKWRVMNADPKVVAKIMDDYAIHLQDLSNEYDTIQDAARGEAGPTPAT